MTIILSQWWAIYTFYHLLVPPYSQINAFRWEHRLEHYCKREPKTRVRLFPIRSRSEIFFPVMIFPRMAGIPICHAKSLAGRGAPKGKCTEVVPGRDRAHAPVREGCPTSVRGIFPILSGRPSRYDKVWSPQRRLVTRTVYLLLLSRGQPLQQEVPQTFWRDSRTVDLLQFLP